MKSLPFHIPEGWKRYSFDYPRNDIHTDNVSLPRCGQCFWLVTLRGKFALTDKRHYPDLRSDTSSVWNFYALSCARWYFAMKTVVLREMSAVFSGYSSVRSSTERIRGLCLLCGLSTAYYAIGGNMELKTNNKKVEWKPFVDSVGIKRANLQEVKCSSRHCYHTSTKYKW